MQVPVRKIPRDRFNRAVESLPKKFKGLSFFIQFDLARNANQTRPSPIIAIASDQTGAKTNTMAVIDECGSVSSEVKSQTAAKKTVTAAASEAKVAERMKRRLDLPSAATTATKAIVGGMQFHNISLAPKPSWKPG